MPPNDINVLRALKQGAVAFLVMMGVSCTLVSNDHEVVSNDRVMAEHSAMKKRLPSIERENDVLKKENTQQRAKMLGLENQIAGLTRDVTQLSQKYAEDMALSEEKIKNLNETIQKNEDESSAKIEALAILNAALAVKMDQEVRALNERRVMDQKAWDQERTKLTTTHAQKEADLSARMDQLQGAVQNKDLEIVSLNNTLAEMSTRLLETLALAEALEKARDESRTELESVKETNGALNQKIEELSQLPPKGQTKSNAQ